MKNLLTLFPVIFIVNISFSQIPAKVDPNHLKEGGFGYMINSDETCSVWWAEGAYKVMRNAPIPARKDGEIKLWSARNEYESFIIVVHPAGRMENFRITTSDFKDGQGNKIDSDNITVRKVEYVKVNRPTDSYGFRGWWPDPLPLYEHPETIFPAENQPFWITVKVPSTANAGDYSGEILLSSDNWKLSVPVRLQVWNFTLPETPTMRSGFGFNFNNVKKYDNIKTIEDEQAAFENYMQSFRDYRISPYNPFELSPIREKVTGVAWEGGFFDGDVSYTGSYSYRIEDNSTTSNTDGRTRELIPVNNIDSYRLSWVARSLEEGQRYVVGVECYNQEKEFIAFENRFEIYTGEAVWKTERLNLGMFNNEIKYLRIRLFPSERTITGEHTGTVWFDEINLYNSNTGQNEFSAGNFEVDPEAIDVLLDFAGFNEAGKRYFDDYGFNGYRLSLKGLGGGTYYSRTNGVFEGFEQGTDEYNRLMKRYLGQIEDNLKKYGWLGKEYIYWFDEPNEPDYPFVIETNELIKKYAPGLTTFITEHVSGQDISDVTDISCTIWHRLDHDKIERMNEQGLEHWSYLCTWPKSPWISLFIDHDAVNLRMWLWASYQHNLKGILIWETTYWNSKEASPPGYLQNPWEETMSFVTGYGWPMGKQTIWGNGDGRFFYPLNRDPNNDPATYTGKPVPSLRLEILRDGIEDYEYFVLLEELVNSPKNRNRKLVDEARELLTIPEVIYSDEKTYSKNPQDLLEYRIKLAEYIIKL